jgi:hypothetical protein
MKKMLFAAAIAVPLSLSLGAVAPMDGPHVASAAIVEKCRNPSGNETQGNCQGEALTKRNENPAGKAPPGQN